ncbi:sulfurtransferase TusA family protein [Roseococcus sp. YIM B11640]|uniref:sulfurtransferase TusA family protein n=1 Tax=Roseococcus sp. YIM B11640 TaxID=3133973 RepID=UPI003C7E18F6
MGDPSPLDLQGLSCPLPVLRANKALRAMAPGETLVVLATDPAAVKDFHAYAQETGHELLAWAEEEEAGRRRFRFALRRRAEP